MKTMTRDHDIKEALDRLISIYERRPEVALDTVKAEGVLEDGMTCRVTAGSHTAVMDLPQTMGGDDAGPTPGFFARAAIVGCVSMGIKMGAVRAGLSLSSIKVKIETDFDDRAVYGLCDKTAAPLETRLLIEIESELPQSDIEALVEDVLTRDPWYLALKDAQVVSTKVKATAHA